MPRKPIIKTNQYPYHVVARSNQKAWFKLNLEEVWEIAKKSLCLANLKHPIELHSFVLMNNHYHLVLTTPDENISEFMYEFNKNFSLDLRTKTNTINRMFGGRYKWSIIKDQNHYYHVTKYVLLNPVKAKVAECANDYPFSTLFYQVKKKAFALPILPYIDLSSKSFLSWLKDPHEEEQNESIKRGLKKSSFRYTGTRKKRTPPLFSKYG